jgi:hypothetical protein
VRSTQALGSLGITEPRARHHSPWRNHLVAHARGRRLDRDLAAGIATWRSPTHAARALQLTSPRNRRQLARSLERLLEHADDPRIYFMSAVVTPPRRQVREARSLIVEIVSRLRSRDPVDAPGVARLATLLRDGAGPCYSRSQAGALTTALENVTSSLDVYD